MNYFDILTNCSVINKYYTWYLNICQAASKRTLKVGQYYEKHHIVPKSLGLGGSTDVNNLVKLTAREHYILHRLLPKFLKSTTHQKKMKYAFWYLSTRNINYKPTSRSYESARKDLIMCIKSRIDSTETRQKKARPGQLNGMYGKTHSAEVKSKLSELAVQKFSGKSYEELYGAEKAANLKIDRSIKLKLYLKENPTARQGKNNSNAKIFELISPDGVKHTINGTLRVFCKEHNLDTGAIIDLAKNRRSSYKGWIGKYLE